MNVAAFAVGFILAGGKSSRMGADKAFLHLGDQTLLDRARASAMAVCESVRVVGAGEKFGSEAIEDIFPNRGPLGGIHAALRSSTRELNLMLAVDLPFIQPEFLNYLLEQARASSAIVTVPRISGGWQPLCAVYRPSFAEVAEKALSAGKNKIDASFAAVQLRVLEEAEILKAGFDAGMFDNLNTPEEAQNAAKRIAQSKSKRSVSQGAGPLN
jgi:molybdenum cofactor guanylyltransferase